MKRLLKPILDLERHHEPLAPGRVFARRMRAGLLLGLAIVTGSLGLGVLGYHYLEGLPWLDALENASMILGGMGPVSEMLTVPGKLFASVYALFSGVAFLSGVGVLLVPLLHRLLHHFHLDLERDR